MVVKYTGFMLFLDVKKSLLERQNYGENRAFSGEFADFQYFIFLKNNQISCVYLADSMFFCTFAADYNLDNNFM